jgi:probable rRNA maturation factor
MQIWIDIQHAESAIPEEWVERTVESILGALELREAEVSILLVDDPEIARLNRQYLERTGPTNVISFSQREGEGTQMNPHLLGDVVISLDTCRREAEEGGIPFEERLQHLLIHGILHLLGYDHEGDEEEARRMEAEEQRMTLAV